jgi:hypothetical protein
VIRQQMGHATADMTAHYTGEIPIEQVTKHLQLASGVTQIRPCRVS